MARSPIRRWLLWGLLFLPVLAVPAAYVLLRMAINDRLQREVTLGKVRLTMSSPRLGWDFEFSADSLRIESPGFSLRAGRVRAEARLWQSLVSLSPSFKASIDTAWVDLPRRPKGERRKALRLRSEKPASFPAIRIPVPFRIEAGRLMISRAGRPLAEAGDLVVFSQGPKGAAVDWEEAKVWAIASPGSDTSGGPGSDVLADSPVVLEGPFRASARWFGKWVRYQARFESAGGDYIRLEGEKRKSDLGRGKDSLEVSVASLTPYAPFFKEGKAPDLWAIHLTAALGLDRSAVANVSLALRTPGNLRLGAQAVTATASLEDSAGMLVIGSQGVRGETLRLQGRFHLPILDSLEGSALLRGFKGNFSGFSRNVRIPLGRKILPGDFEIKRLRIADGAAQAEVRTRDSTELRLNVFRDSTWRCLFTGTAGRREAWAHAWTDTNISWRSATVTGEFRPGQVDVEVIGKEVRAYGAAADSLWARNVVKRRGYYLADSRLYYKGEVWPVKGEVEWSDRKAVRSSRGLRLRRDVALSFRTAHARHGVLEYSMPRRRNMAVHAGNLAVEHLPIPRLEKALAYHPVLTGDFAWDWENRHGESALEAVFSFAGERLGLDLEAGWDARLLKVPVLEVSVAGSRLRFGAELRLGGRQFHQLRKLGLQDVQSMVLEAERFDASRLVTLLPGLGILEAGTLNGKLGYSDSAGFNGVYLVDSLRFKPLRNLMDIQRISFSGANRDIILKARTASPKYPWLNDTLTLKVIDFLGGSPGLSLAVSSTEGLSLSFSGAIPDFKSLRGSFVAEGNLSLPGGAGLLRDFRLSGRMEAPLDKGFLPNLNLDSGVVQGRYAVQGLDTQSFRGEVGIRDGRIVIPTLRAADEGGRTLSGQAECSLRLPFLLTAKVRGEGLALQLQGLRKLVFRDVEASVRIDSSGTAAAARVGKVAFQSAKGAVAANGDLENLFLNFSKGRPGANGKEPIPQLGLKARMRNFNIKHKIGFREMQRFFRTVKVDKRKKRIRPMDLNISLEAVGGENRIETDILRMYFTGDLAVKGIYPYTLLSGEVSALSGEIGQTSQSYNIVEFGLKWQNATMEEGRVYVEGGKKLRVDCRPETKRTCNVFIKLEGRLDEMAFTYDSDCGQTAGGEVIEPAALINSVSRGCYSGDYVSGAGGGGYGEAVFTFLEPTISDNLTRRVSQATGGWIKSTQVSGIGAMVSRDTTGIAEPISVGVESKEKWGMKVMAKAGYHPEKKVLNPWENKVALEWRPPLEKVAKGSDWKRRVRDRVTLEASAETRPEEKLEEEEERQVRRQVGIRYRYQFWNLW